MSGNLRVLVEQGPKGKRFVAHAADWPGLERNGRGEDAAIEKLLAYVPRYRRVAVRARFGKELPDDPQPTVIERYTGTGSTDFWGISFAPAALDRAPYDKATFERNVKLLRAVWAEFDDIAGRVSAELRPGPRGGGRDRDRIIRHVLANEGGDFSKRVKVPAELDELATPAGRRGLSGPIRRRHARLVCRGQIPWQLDNPVPAPPHGVSRAGPRVGDGGPGLDERGGGGGRRLRLAEGPRDAGALLGPGGSAVLLYRPFSDRQPGRSSNGRFVGTSRARATPAGIGLAHQGSLHRSADDRARIRSTDGRCGDTTPTRADRAAPTPRNPTRAAPTPRHAAAATLR